MSTKLKILFFLALILLGLSFAASKVTFQVSGDYPTVGDYTKSFFDPAEKHRDLPSYTEKTLNELNSQKDLIGIKCTPDYSSPGDGFFSYYSDGKRVENKNSEINNLIYRLENLYPNDSLQALQVCLTENNRTFIEYEITEGKNSNVDVNSYLAEEKEGQIKNITQIFKDQTYFACGNPLQLTKDDIFYLKCTGGDGTVSINQVYKIDLTKSKVLLIQECRYDYAPDYLSSIVSCK